MGERIDTPPHRKNPWTSAGAGPPLIDLGSRAEIIRRCGTKIGRVSWTFVRGRDVSAQDSLPGGAVRSNDASRSGLCLRAIDHIAAGPVLPGASLLCDGPVHPPLGHSLDVVERV